MQPGAAHETPRAAPRPRTSRVSRAAEDRRLLIRYHRHGDQAAREELVERLLPLARRMARRYRRSDEPLDDLVQVATLGLIKAIDRFDPARETAFSSYAVPTMLGELKRYFRDNGWAVHVPRGMQERVMQVDNAVKDLSRKLGRSPSAAEVAETLEPQRRSRCSRRWRRPAPTTPSRSSPTASATRATARRTPSRSASRTSASSSSSTAPRSRRRSRRCRARDRIVLHLRFVEDLTQAEIAERVGVSQMHVSRLIRRALERLRTVAEHSG